MSNKETPDIKKARQFWDSIYETAAPFVNHHTIPIFINKDGELKLHGTGILIKHENQYFLVSAAHVLEINNSNDIVLGSSATNGLPLNKYAKFTPHIKEIKDREKDKIDLAVVMLFESELLEQLKENYQFIPSQAIIEDHIDSENLPNYLVFGYPEFGIEIKSSQNGLEIDSTSMVMPTKVSPFMKFEKYDCNSNDHIFVEYFKNMTIADGTKSLNKIKPHCISGCGLWYIDMDLIQKANKIRYALIGVIIECQLKYHRILIATKMKHVMSLIKAHIAMKN